MRRNKDTLGIEEWTAVDPTPNDDWTPPEIPDWVNATPRIEAIYEFLMQLPQSRQWRAGEYFLIWMSLPTIERYLSRPGGETLKSLMGLFGPNLNLTNADMAKARQKWKEVDEEEAEEITAETKARVVKMEDRRKRLGG